MKPYFSDPVEGVCDAFFELYPDAELKDLVKFFSEQERSDSDPRVALYGLANLCDQALEKLTSTYDRWIDAPTVARISGALAHFETAIRAYSAVIGHRRFHTLSRLSPVDALRKCFPHEVALAELV